MNALLQGLRQIRFKLNRHAFGINPYGHAIFHDLDDLIGHRNSFMDFIKFEYSLTIFYNLVVAIPSLYYYFSRYNIIMHFDKISALFLLIANLTKIIDIIPKLILVYLCIRISRNSNDPLIIARRLMYMSRSNIYFYNSMLTYFLLIQYTIYALFIRHPNYCPGASEFYHIINLLIYGFFIRILLCFIDYLLHFKIGINREEEDNNNLLYKDIYNRVPEDVLNMIETTILSDSNINKLVPLTNDNERDICCICMIPFGIGDLIRLMPCDKKHIFHKACIDKWLSHNKSCPTCRTEITRKLISIKKID